MYLKLIGLTLLLTVLAAPAPSRAEPAPDGPETGAVAPLDSGSATGEPAAAVETAVAPDEAAAAAMPAATDPGAGPVLEPFPLVTVKTAGEADRNPFDEPPPAVVPRDYAMVKEKIQLRGVVSAGGRSVGLFTVEGDTGGRDEGTILKRYERNDTILVLFDRKEFQFTVMSLDHRSAVLRGLDDKLYKVWL
ncbi:hypothetical protein [Desulfofustis glycolicus]|uniref:Pilus assembly protein, PilP n=1 Tax=Desulfofustis glycolicus DSM 9705 TaxID=1121409 RepID=A0A1M5YMQ5_9BACT|nr:hypothetical protein [Desulfofustis glycolicus]SHI13292.1 hypothetical protein SAMN02745124_04231 [Desulfofustis glycolicus DSM 9705]